MFLVFLGMEISSPKLEKLVIFQTKLPKPKNKKKFILVFVKKQNFLN